MVVIKLAIKHVKQDILDHYVCNVTYIIREDLDILGQKINSALFVMKVTKIISIFCYPLFGKYFRYFLLVGHYISWLNNIRN